MADDPLWLENAGAVYNAGEYRRLFSRIFQRAGVFGDTELEVSQRGAGANLSVDVSAGACFVNGTEATSGATRQGIYFYNSEAVQNVAIAAGGALGRIDLVGVRIRDSAYSGAINSGEIVVVQGAESASPTTPTPPDNFFALAQVTVAAGASSIVTANITDLRPFWNLGTYMAPWSTAWGEYSSAEKTSDTALTVPVTIATAPFVLITSGRKIIVTANVGLLVNTSGERGRIYIEESVNGGAYTEVAEVCDHKAATSAARVGASAVYRKSITTLANYSYRLVGTRVSGSGTVTAEAAAANPAQITVSDNGPGAFT